MIKDETYKYDLMANERFDSEKNWSIMIDKEQNEIRNHVMRKFKSRQLKRRNLHNFIRETREDIIKLRKEQEEELAMSGFSQDGLSTAADTAIKLDGIKTKEQLQNQVGEEFMDFMKGIVTKNRSQPVPTNASKQNEANRKRLLN